MKHDITKLDPIHQKAYQEFISSEYTPNEVPDELYEVYLKLKRLKIRLKRPNLSGI